MLFAKTEAELIEMVELLTEAFATVGLELNAAKFCWKQVARLGMWAIVSKSFRNWHNGS